MRCKRDDDASAGRRGHRGPSRRLHLFATGVVLGITAAIISWPPLSGPDRPSASRIATGSVAGVRVATGPPASPDGLALDPAQFARGACVAFSPTAGNRQQTVFLDAGHGGPDPGAGGITAAGQRVDETHLTLPVALAASRNLRAHGYRVVLSRTVDTAVAPVTTTDATDTGYTTSGKHRDLVARIRCADLAGADALVSIHFDAYYDSDIRGAMTLYDDARTFSAANDRLATLLEHDIVAAMSVGGWQVPDRGVAPDTVAGGGEQTARGDAYGHLDILGPPDPRYLEQATTMPGALTEPLFITNPAEGTAAASPAGQQAIASGIADGVDEFLRS
jgi:N-acetylmuramoyl-L-alanine amidase